MGIRRDHETVAPQVPTRRHRQPTGAQHRVAQGSAQGTHEPSEICSEGRGEVSGPLPRLPIVAEDPGADRRAQSQPQSATTASG